MDKSPVVSPAAAPVAAGTPAMIVVQQVPEQTLWQRLMRWGFITLLGISLMCNLTMCVQYGEYFNAAEGPDEKFHSGDRDASAKIARISISGTIMPPYSERTIKAIKKALKDDSVKGVILIVDSPGGLVTDSHQIYHRLKELSAKKPVFVSMKSLAASGGYYIAMGAGETAKIYAEPTTWTGSIGVILPHFEIAGLAEKIGVKSVPIKTGEFKDALNPFRELTDSERQLWTDIIQQSFEQFLQVIDDNRGTLNMEQVKSLATGAIYTAKDAKKHGLVDEIGYEEEAVEALKKQLNLEHARVVKYEHTANLFEALMDSAHMKSPKSPWESVLEAAVPRAMYMCTSLPVVQVPRGE